MPAPRRAEAEEAPLDRDAVERALALQRARRRARLERERERRRARKRFSVLVAALLFSAVFLALTVWSQIQALFGL